MRWFAVAVITLLLAAVPLMAQDVTFQWDPYTDVAQGFHLYSSKSGGSSSYSGTPPIMTWQPVSLTTGSIPRPSPGHWCFVMTAFTVDGVESDLSNEVCTNIKPKPPRIVSAIQTAMTKTRDFFAGLVGKQKKGLRITSS